ncbi:MAG: rhomboid family intramembrane serine protease [Chitinivibrionales bacterium]|nr:rhomboid family intramembrane serine protease [Chitinivibrionales bacterium]
MLFLPISTDVHDGRIRMAALWIAAICLLAHLFVADDINKVEAELEAIHEELREQEFKEMFNERGEDAIPDMRKMITDVKNVNSTVEQKLKAKAKERRKSMLIYKFGLVPKHFNILNLISHMFVHGGWLHLFGNLWFFYLCGVAMEKYWGFGRFLTSYLTCGIGASIFFLVFNALTGNLQADTPLIGASGAIAGTMGAFVVTHAKCKVNVFYFFMLLFMPRWGTFVMPATFYFGLWFVFQVVQGAILGGDLTGVAYTAHVGGFVIGLGLGKFLGSEDEDALVSPPKTRSKKTPPKRKAFIDTSISAPARAGSPIESDALPPVPRIAQAWNAFNERDYATSSRLITEEMDVFLQNPRHYHDALVDTMYKIIRHWDLLELNPSHVYQWAKRLSQLGLHNLAISAFDLIAAEFKSGHLYMSSMYNAAYLRIQTRSDPEKAREGFKKLIDADPDNVLSRQASKYLQSVGAL